MASQEDKVEGVAVAAVQMDVDEPLPERPARLAFCERFRRLWVVILLMFFVGLVAATPSTIIPQLQQDAFGNSSFVVAGGFATGKGVIGCLVVPLYGSFSDVSGRRQAVLVALCATMIPVAVFLLSQNFWLYSIVDALVGFNDATMTLLLAQVAQLVPIATGSHAESFALSVAAFFLGISVAPFIGAFLDVTVTFMVSGGLLIVALVLAYLFFHDHSPLSAPLLGDVAVANAQLPSLANKAHFHRLLDAFTLSRDLRIVALVVFANGLAENLLDSLLLLYLDEVLNFTSTEQAVVIAILGAGSVFGLVVVTTAMRAFFGSLGTLRIELVANAAICVLYSFVTSTWGIYVTTAMSVVGMGVFPCACAVAALCLPQEAAGVAQGVAAGARMLAGGVGPLLFGYVFQATQHSLYPGATFFVAAISVLTAFALTRFLGPRFSTSKL